LGKTVELFKKQYASFEEQDRDILEVYDSLYKIATAGGDKSQDYKIGSLSHLIRQLDPLSARYLVRIPQAVMRLGFSDMTVLDAYSWMVSGDKTHRKLIENAYHVRPDLGYIGSLIKERGIEKLKRIEPHVFTPIIMMRAERLSSGAEIINQIGTCAVEPKYDGFRLQVHFNRREGKVKLYSRSLEEVSPMYPDLIEGILHEVRGDEVILEGEAIGFDPQTGAFLPFQETVQRKRKYGITEKAKEIPLRLFCFELLYRDGISYIHQTFEKRRSMLEQVVGKDKDAKRHLITLAPHSIISDPQLLEQMFEDAIAGGLEGIIAKKTDGMYQPGARAWNWIKLKRSYSSKINDTLDCVVMGYDAGKGKRTDFGIGAFLVGILDEEKGIFSTVAKIGTGLTDAEWGELKKRCDTFKTGEKPGQYDVDRSMGVDVWVNPSVVVEIRADEITRSPVHTAGKAGADGQGYALRFPRLERFREDKTPQQASTLQEIKDMFIRAKRE
jgi:DNA ligase-1